MQLEYDAMDGIMGEAGCWGRRQLLGKALADSTHAHKRRDGRQCPCSGRPDPMRRRRRTGVHELANVTPVN